MLGQSLPPASYKMLGPSAAPHPALGFWEEQVLPSYGHITMASQRWKWSMVNEPGNSGYVLLLLLAFLSLL